MVFKFKQLPSLLDPIVTLLLIQPSQHVSKCDYVYYEVNEELVVIKNVLLFYVAPAVAPQIPADPVPEDTIKPTSVVLTWEAIPPDDANGELTYIVMIEVTNQMRRKRQTNTLQQCLDAAGIANQFNISVPGDQTSTTLSGIGMNLI